jgi:hypothetical protein
MIVKNKTKYKKSFLEIPIKFPAFGKDSSSFSIVVLIVQMELHFLINGNWFTEKSYCS